MNTLNTKQRLPSFERNWAFFLDIDGTLCALEATPAQVAPDPETISLLQALLDHTGGAVALISGRRLTDIRRMFSPLRMPAAGQHGAERCDVLSQHFASPIADVHLETAAERLRPFIADHPELLLEHKGLTLALHYRAAPHLKQKAETAMMYAMENLASAYNVQAGKMVWELKPKQYDKGWAIEQFMRNPPFALRKPVFIGDDITDEFAFRTVNRIGGHSIKVTTSPELADATHANWRLEDPRAVISWLGQYIDYYSNKPI